MTRPLYRINRRAQADGGETWSLGIAAEGESQILRVVGSVSDKHQIRALAVRLCAWLNDPERVDKCVAVAVRGLDRTANVKLEPAGRAAGWSVARAMSLRNQMLSVKVDPEILARLRAAAGKLLYRKRTALGAEPVDPQPATTAALVECGMLLTIEALESHDGRLLRLAPMHPHGTAPGHLSAGCAWVGEPKKTKKRRKT